MKWDLINMTSYFFILSMRKFLLDKNTTNIVNTLKLSAVSHSLLNTGKLKWQRDTAAALTVGKPLPRSQTSLSIREHTPGETLPVQQVSESFQPEVPSHFTPENPHRREAL